MRYAITGPTGAIGSEIVRLALSEGHEVLAIVRPNSSRLGNLPEHRNLKIIECELSQYDSLPSNEKCDVFIHLGWGNTLNGQRDDVRIQVDNIGYALDAVDLAHRWGASAFIGAGSQAEYGHSDEDLTSDTPTRPTSGYGIAKCAAGRMCGLRCSQLGMRFCWVRILSVFGPNDSKSTLISYLLESFLDGRVPELTECEQVWDYLYAKDAARAFLLIGDKGRDGSTYVLGSGSKRTLKEYVLALRDTVGSSLGPEFGKKPYYPHQAMRLCADISKLTEDTGFVPEYSFEDGIRDILKNRGLR